VLKAYYTWHIVIFLITAPYKYSYLLTYRYLLSYYWQSTCTAAASHGKSITLFLSAPWTVMGKIKFAVCLSVCLSCLSVLVHRLWNCSMDLAEMLLRDGDLSWTLCLAFWWRSPQWSCQGSRKYTTGEILGQPSTDRLVYKNCWLQNV